MLCNFCELSVVDPHFYKGKNDNFVTITSDRHINMLRSFLEPKVNVNDRENFQDEAILVKGL